MWQRISKNGPKPAFTLDGKYCERFFVGRRFPAIGWVWSVHAGTTEYYWDNTICAESAHNAGCAYTHWMAVPAILNEGDQYDPGVDATAKPDTKRRGKVPVPRVRAKPSAPRQRVPVVRSTPRNLRGGAR
jgi:hypothetical protein